MVTRNTHDMYRQGMMYVCMYDKETTDTPDIHVLEREVWIEVFGTLFHSLFFSSTTRSDERVVTYVYSYTFAVCHAVGD